jgi:glycosyltransferase involved in cell wall biosynthesis
MADFVVYQSHFVETWWNSVHGECSAPSTNIYNGVDLARFNPQGPRLHSKAGICIISVEGNQGTDKYETGVQLAQGLEQQGLSVELLMFGKSWKDADLRFARNPMVRYMGVVANQKLPYFYRGADLFIATDIVSACPNSVIESLACGTPVLGYKAGVLPEMLDEASGQCVEYYGNPLKAEPPGNPSEIVCAARILIEKRDFYSTGARRLAEQRYSLDQMVDAYLQVILG